MYPNPNRNPYATIHIIIIGIPLVATVVGRPALYAGVVWLWTLSLATGYTDGTRQRFVWMQALYPNNTQILIALGRFGSRMELGGKCYQR